MVDGNGAHMYFAGRVYARNHSIPAEHIAQSIQHCMLARAAAATVTAEMEQFHGAGGAPDRRQRWKNISSGAPSPWLQCHQRDRGHPTKCASAVILPTQPVARHVAPLQQRGSTAVSTVVEPSTSDTPSPAPTAELYSSTAYTLQPSTLYNPLHPPSGNVVRKSGVESVRRWMGTASMWAWLRVCWAIFHVTQRRPQHY